MIKIQNIYYMLSYAFKELNKIDSKKFDDESFENHADLCAEILLNAVNRIIKTGFKRDYKEVSEFMKSPRGKMELQETVNRLSFFRPEIYCTHDVFSENIFINRLLKSTLRYLLKQNIKDERKLRITKVLRYFSLVDDINLKNIRWNLALSNAESKFRIVIFICKLVYKHSIMKYSDTNFNKKDQEFFTEDALHKIYEHFILEFYRKEYKDSLQADALVIDWCLDDDQSYLLPKMQSDVLLRSRKSKNTLIIDAKFYKRILQNRYDKDSVRSNNLYQIFTYTKNYAIKFPENNVSGMLLYAQTEEDVIPDDVCYSMSGNKIHVCTLDLNADFSAIKERLHNVAALINNAD